MNFVPYAGKWYKLFSVWVFTLIGILSVVQPNLASLGISETWQGYVTAALAGLGVVARLIGQPTVTQDSGLDN